MRQKPPPDSPAKRGHACCLLAVLALCGSVPLTATADDRENGRTGAAPDLSLSDFFSTGWDEPWEKRPRGDGTPDMSLLRVQTNFLAQLLRLDTFVETGMTAPGARRSEFVNGTIEYALSRRFMPAIFLSHQWLGESQGRGKDGAAGGFFGRLQLVDGQRSSLALNLKMALPNTDVGEHATIWSYALAGWADLATLGMGRTGLYWHLQHEMAGGPTAPGAARNDAAYALSLAASWTGPQAALGNLTTFAEAAGKTLLDGDHSGRTALTITPGFRFTLGGRHILMAGVDVPVAGPKAFGSLYRLTYIFNF
jgi:hypothetical protein